MKDPKKIKRQEELLKHFEGMPEGYQEKQVGNLWYVRSWNPAFERYFVAIYTQENFNRFKGYWASKNEQEDLDVAFLDKINDNSS
jgi:hypothetical protein